jgi:Heparinase II/III-like protein
MKTLFLFLPLVFLVIFSAVAQSTPVGSTTRLPPHPRILLLKGEEAPLKQAIAADRTWTSVQQVILAECDKMLTVAPVERIQIGRRLLDKSREALRRIFFLSYAWRITQQETYRQRAEKELLAVSAFSDWNPSHFLDVAEMTMAVAIGYDWLYNDLSEASRATIREAILKKGIEPSMDPKNNGWLTATHNWNQVCNAGITYGALAIYDEQPELARTVINRAIGSIALPMGDYVPDGAYPEGYSYWGYGTSFNVLFISAVEKALGQDFGLSQRLGFLKTAGYMVNMTGPTGSPFNYSDSGPTGELQPALFWFAQKTRDPSLLWVERGRLLNGEATKNARDRIFPTILLWGAHTNVATIPAPASTLWMGSGKTPVALMRTSWTDPAALFVGLKGGSPSVNHAHMDAGSFVMEADGVRWAMDFGMQDYNSLETKGVDLWNKAQNSGRWQVFRYSNRVHNTLTVNDGLQLVAGNAPITHSSGNPQFLNATTNMTELYAGSLASASRGVAIVDQSYVVVRDELQTTPDPATLVSKSRAELIKDGKKLIIQVQEPAGVTLKTWSTDPPHDYDTPNPGTTLVGFEVMLPASASRALTVLLIPGKASDKPTSAVPPLAQWPR